MNPTEYLHGHKYILFAVFLSSVGSELQTWTLYFSLLVLCGILPLVYYQHRALFVEALQILNLDAITPSDMSTACQDFHQNFPGIHGKLYVLISSIACNQSSCHSNVFLVSLL